MNKYAATIIRHHVGPHTTRAQLRFVFFADDYIFAHEYAEHVARNLHNDVSEYSVNVEEVV
jgi:hypothetical protein